MTGVELLSTGEVELVGLIPYASNYTLLAKVVDGGRETLAIYKPNRGERPLWDFPTGTLAGREVCAYLVSQASGWNLVPPTILRDDAPLGPGSLQLFIEHDPERHYFAIEDEYEDELKVVAAFDVVVNNADRKAGHVLEDAARKLWAVDHGVTFHTDPKLRTVIWRYAEEPVPEALLADMTRLRDAMGSVLHGEISDLLTAEEADATAARIEALIERGVFPSPDSMRPLPWPLI